MITSGTRPKRMSSGWRRPASWAALRRSTHCATVANATRCPATQARMPKATERWDLPVPGGPKNTASCGVRRRSPTCPGAALGRVRGSVGSCSRILRGCRGRDGLAVHIDIDRTRAVSEQQRDESALFVLGCLRPDRSGRCSEPRGAAASNRACSTAAESRRPRSGRRLQPSNGPEPHDAAEPRHSCPTHRRPRRLRSDRRITSRCATGSQNSVSGTPIGGVVERFGAPSVSSGTSAPFATSDSASAA